MRVSGRGHLSVADILSEDAAGWRILARFPSVVVELEVERVAAPWRVGEESELLTSSVGGTHWTVPMPLGRFTGWAVRPGSRTRIGGWAYQDHNWGAGRLDAYFRSWRWSAAAGDHGARVSVEVVDRDWRQNRLALVVDHDGNRHAWTEHSGRGGVRESLVKCRTYQISPVLRAAYRRTSFDTVVSGRTYHGVAETVRIGGDGR